MISKVCAVVLLTLALLGCGRYGGVTSVRGSGVLKTEAREVSNFTNVVLTGVGDLNVTQGDSEGLTIEADDNILPLIKSDVSGGTLTIGIRDENQVAIPSKGPTFNLNVKNLNSVQMSGAGNLKAPSLKSDTLALSTSGAGNMDVSQLQATMLNVNVSGAGNITLGGEIQTQTASLSGLGNYEADNLKTTNTAITISGAGNATVWASQSLTIQISGAGALSYYGSPTVQRTISGVGTVKALGNK